MKIIDYERKGNVVRYYLGEKTEDWGWTNKDYKDYNGKIPNWLKPSDDYYGDDWDDVPYECNAGQVYDEFIKGYIDIAYNFNVLVLEPSEQFCKSNSRWCKEDMRNRYIPCIIVVPENLINTMDQEGAYYMDFNSWVGNDKVIKYYFNDNSDILINDTVGRVLS